MHTHSVIITVYLKRKKLDLCNAEYEVRAKASHQQDEITEIKPDSGILEYDSDVPVSQFQHLCVSFSEFQLLNLCLPVSQLLYPSFLISAFPCLNPCPHKKHFCLLVF